MCCLKHVETELKWNIYLFDCIRLVFLNQIVFMYLHNVLNCSVTKKQLWRCIWMEYIFFLIVILWIFFICFVEDHLLCFIHLQLNSWCKKVALKLCKSNICTASTKLIEIQYLFDTKMPNHAVMYPTSEPQQYCLLLHWSISYLFNF